MGVVRPLPKIIHVARPLCYPTLVARAIGFTRDGSIQDWTAQFGTLNFLPPLDQPHAVTRPLGPTLQTLSGAVALNAFGPGAFVSSVAIGFVTSLALALPRGSEPRRDTVFLMPANLANDWKVDGPLLFFVFFVFVFLDIYCT